jgi:GNAT superfamily N-acetyltransferase
MNIQIRPATKTDLTAIHQLIRELAIYELSPESHTATVADYEKDLADGIFFASVAVDTDANLIVGMILYHYAYSTWRGRMMYLEDFVVTESYRQFGIGQQLFDTFVALSKEKECKLVKWQVLDWNTPAIKFYEKNKATIEKEWYNGKIIF